MECPSSLSHDVLCDLSAPRQTENHLIVAQHSTNAKKTYSIGCDSGITDTFDLVFNYTQGFGVESFVLLAGHSFPQR